MTLQDFLARYSIRGYLMEKNGMRLHIESAPGFSPNSKTGTVQFAYIDLLDMVPRCKTYNPSMTAAQLAKESARVVGELASVVTWLQGENVSIPPAKGLHVTQALLMRYHLDTIGVDSAAMTRELILDGRTVASRAGVPPMKANADYRVSVVPRTGNELWSRRFPTLNTCLDALEGEPMRDCAVHVFSHCTWPDDTTMRKLKQAALHLLKEAGIQNEVVPTSIEPLSA